MFPKFKWTFANIPTLGKIKEIIAWVGTAIVAGDFTGINRGERALDITVQRNNQEQTAQGEEAITIGQRNKAFFSALALGGGNQATGNYSVAIGTNNEASGAASIAIGQTASGQDTKAIAIGNTALATSEECIAIGNDTQAGQIGDTGAIAIGPNARATGTNSIAIGYAATTAVDDEAIIEAIKLWLQQGATNKLVLHSDMTNGAGAGAGTLANAPAAGNPTKWIPVDDAGTIRYIPMW